MGRLRWPRRAIPVCWSGFLAALCVFSYPDRCLLHSNSNGIPERYRQKFRFEWHSWALQTKVPIRSLHCTITCLAVTCTYVGQPLIQFTTSRNWLCRRTLSWLIYLVVTYARHWWHSWALQTFLSVTDKTQIWTVYTARLLASLPAPQIYWLALRTARKVHQPRQPRAIASSIWSSTDFNWSKSAVHIPQNHGRSLT